MSHLFGKILYLIEALSFDYQIYDALLIIRCIYYYVLSLHFGKIR